MNLDELRSAAHTAAAIQADVDAAGMGRPESIESLYGRALDALADETRRRQAAEDAAGRRALLLRQCRAWVPPAIAAAIAEELGGQHG
jgi:hypothetical protein